MSHYHKTLPILGLLLAASLVCPSAFAQRSTPVTVVNDDSNPIPVVTDNDLSQREGFAERVTAAFGTFRGIPTSDRVAGTDFLTPADATLVIEYMTLRATQDNADQIGFVEIRATSRGTTISHSLPVASDLVSLPAGSSQKITNYAWPLKIYVDPGTDVILNLNSIAGSAGGSAAYTVSGYLVPVGSPSLGP